MPTNFSVLPAFSIIIGVLAWTPSFAAGEPQAPAWLDKAWSSTLLYEHPENPSIQDFRLVGRYHGQYWSVDAEQGRADNWDNRRIIFGLQTRFLNQFKLEAQMHVNEDLDPVYDELYVGFLEWAPGDHDISVSLGRLDYVYAGLERSTSSKKMATFERSALVSQLMPGEVFGLYGKTGFPRGSAQLGIFTGAITEEFGDLDSGTAATVGFEYELPLLYDSGSLHLDYLFNDGDPRNSAFSAYRDVVSIWHQGHSGPWSLGLDLTLGLNNTEELSNVWGLTLLPALEIARHWLVGGDELQLALRYHYANSADANGLMMPRRYEGEVADGEGDRYQSLYAGLNYLYYGDKLKFMTGLEYADMADSAGDGGAYAGWTWLAGVRLYF